LQNALVAIDGLGIDCRYDVYHDKILVKEHASEIGGDALENLDNVVLKVRQAVLSRFGFDPSSQFTFDALKICCLDRVFDPVRDYLDGLCWDGRKRLDRWLIEYCEAGDTALNRAIGRKMLVAGVRRVRMPGCKFDYIVVLEGEQGAGKSTLLRTLAGAENFSDNEILGLDKREQQEAIQGIWIYEIGELEGIYKSAVTKVKLFASKTVDSARPAYGRARVDRPRRGIFVATTNDDTYLRDTTGNRRFWPVKVGKIDLVAAARDRDQLWAEAAAVEAGGEPLVIPEALWPDAMAEQQARLELDPWEDAICDRLAPLLQKTGSPFVLDGFALAADGQGAPEWRVASDWLLTDVLALPKDRQNNNHTKRLASIMRKLGWAHPPTPLRFGKSVRRGFTKEIGEQA
jgi:predicted P-loop ATPase